MLLLAALAIACPSAIPAQVSAFAGTRKYTIDVDTLGVTLPVRVSADSAWSLLPGIYASLGLPLDENDSKARRLGTCWKRVRGRLGGSQLSRYLDCGELRQMPNADRSRWVTLESLCDVIAFLLSDASRDVSGAALPVYGRVGA